MSDTGRTFLHVDMDAFYAAIEQRDHPELRGQPVVVGAPPNARGVVSAASYEARTFGIHSAMPSRTAAQRCPHAVFVPVDMPRYQTVSRQVFTIFERFTPLLEPLSVDEAFLDVTGCRLLFGDGEAVAQRIRETIRHDLELTASVGVAPNKFLAKLASDLHKPDGLTVVPRPPHQRREFLSPLPVSRIWGVGKVTRTTLEAAGVHTIGDLQRADPQRLAARLGRHATDHLRRLAFGEDDRELELERQEKSMSREYTFGHDCGDMDQVRQALFDLVEDVARRLRAAGQYASLARLKLRWSDFTTITRQHPLPTACHDTHRLREAAEKLWDQLAPDQPIRLVGFGAARLSEHPTTQMLLFDEDGRPGDDRHDRISHAVDGIRDRYGREKLRRGSRVRRDRSA